MKFFHRHASISAWKIGLLQTAILLAYILTFALTVTSPFAQKVHDGLFQYPPVGVLTFLTTFVFSALFCGTTILGYPIFLCLQKEYRRAVQIVLWSIVWLALFLCGVACIAVVNL